MELYNYEIVADKNLQDKYRKFLQDKIKQLLKAKGKRAKKKNNIIINQYYNDLYALESNLIHKDFLNSLGN